MATKAEVHDMIETLKGHRVIDFQEFEDSKHQEIRNFKRQFNRDWNANHEKVEKQMEEKVKMIHALGEEWVELAYPEEIQKNSLFQTPIQQNLWKKNISIKIVIIEEAQE